MQPTLPHLCPRTVMPSLSLSSSLSLSLPPRLFSEAQSRVNALKRDLREGRARVGTHSSSLQHHWREAEMLRDALKELGDIETHAAAPAKLTEMLR